MRRCSLHASLCVDEDQLVTCRDWTSNASFVAYAYTNDSENIRKTISRLMPQRRLVRASIMSQKLHWQNVFRKHCRARERETEFQSRKTWPQSALVDGSAYAARHALGVQREPEMRSRRIWLVRSIDRCSDSATDGEKFLRARNEKRWKPIYIKATTQNARTRRGNEEKKIVKAETVYLHSNSPQDATPIAICVWR